MWLKWQWTRWSVSLGRHSNSDLVLDPATPPSPCRLGIGCGDKSVVSLWSSLLSLHLAVKEVSVCAPMDVSG